MIWPPEALERIEAHVPSDDSDMEAWGESAYAAIQQIARAAVAKTRGEEHPPNWGPDRKCPEC